MASIFTGNGALVGNTVLEGRLLERICETQRHVEALAEKPRSVRPALIGHLTLVAEIIIGWQHRQETLPEAFHSPSWTDYALRAFPEIKKRDQHILGGSTPAEKPSEDDSAGEDAIAINGVFPTGADERVYPWPVLISPSSPASSCKPW